MSLRNMNGNPELTRDLVFNKVFESNPLVVVDVGARGGLETYWSVYEDQLSGIGFEPDVPECEKLNKHYANSPTHFYPYALHKDKNIRDFFISAYPSSCSFYEPDENFWKRFLDEFNVRVIRRIQLETVDFDSFAKYNEIDYVDFIKLDTEGCELDVLEGAQHFLEQSVLGVSVEVEFSKVHKYQPLFSDVDLFLRSLGFQLFDLSTYKHSRKALPKRLYPHSSGQGQILWGQALFLRDGVRELDNPQIRKRWNEIRILKLASLMELFNLQDCAVELFQAAHRHALCTQEMMDTCVNLLVPTVNSKRLTYDEYFDLLVIKELPHFIKSVLQTRPDLNVTVVEIVSYLKKRQFRLGLDIIKSQLVYLAETESTDAEWAWQKYFYNQLVGRIERLSDLVQCGTVTIS